MKTLIKTFRVAALPLLVSLVACSGADTKPKPAVVTLQGVNATGVSYMSLALSDVTVTVDGTAVPVKGISGAMDLARKGENSVAQFPDPHGARSVSVNLVFDDYGAYQSGNGAAGIVDARGKALSLTFPGSAFDSGSVSISLDIGRSLFPSAGALALEPHFVASAF